jgi:RimJ/RimL family protein N-acetyltransferase
MSYQEFLKYSKEELVYGGTASKRLAIDTLDGRHIGNCMCYDIDVRRGQAELGIMIGDRGYWEKGYGTDSVDTLLSYLFADSSLKRVYLHTLDWNSRARRSFAKSGFRDVKSVRRSGMDFVLMEIHRDDWNRRQADLPVDEPTEEVERPSPGQVYLSPEQRDD